MSDSPRPTPLDPRVFTLARAHAHQLRQQVIDEAFRWVLQALRRVACRVLPSRRPQRPRAQAVRGSLQLGG